MSDVETPGVTAVETEAADLPTPEVDPRPRRLVLNMGRVCGFGGRRGKTAPVNFVLSANWPQMCDIRGNIMRARGLDSALCRVLMDILNP